MVNPTNDENDKKEERDNSEILNKISKQSFSLW